MSSSGLLRSLLFVLWFLFHLPFVSFSVVILLFSSVPCVYLFSLLLCNTHISSVTFCPLHLPRPPAMPTYACTLSLQAQLSLIPPQSTSFFGLYSVLSGALCISHAMSGSPYVSLCLLVHLFVDVYQINVASNLSASLCLTF